MHRSRRVFIQGTSALRPVTVCRFPPKFYFHASSLLNIYLALFIAARGRLHDCAAEKFAAENTGTRAKIRASTEFDRASGEARAR